MMNKLLASCIVGLMLLTPLGLLGQNSVIPCFPPPPCEIMKTAFPNSPCDTTIDEPGKIPCFPLPPCPPITPVEIDSYCNADNDNCESKCANLNILFITTSEGRAYFPSSSNNKPIHQVISDQVERFRVALTNSNINHKTVSYSIYDDDGSKFTRTTDINCDVKVNLPGDPEIQSLRAQYTADIVVYIPYDLSYNYYGGIASRIGPDSAHAYSIITASILGEREYVLAHELGHLLGARHDRETLAVECVDSSHISSCQHAWKYIDSNGDQVRTIMAYPGPNGTFATRIPYFSSPTNLTADGDIPGNTDPSKPVTDNAKIISRTFCDVADFESLDRIVLQHGEGDSRDAYVQYGQPFWNIPSPANNTNHGSEESIILSSNLLPLTNFFSFFSKKRIYLDFDRSRIPAGSEIIEARLSLFYNPDDQIENTNGHTGDNTFTIKRVYTNWDEQTINWNNQPQTVNNNSVTVPASTSNTQDYLSIDLTSMFQDIFYPCPNLTTYGFQLELLNEQATRSVILASSEHPNPDLRPKLELTFKSCDPFPSVNCFGFKKQAAPIIDFVKAYPNPTTDKLSLKFSEAQDSKIQLFDLQGKLMLNQESIGQYDAKISLGHLPKGVYILKVSTDGLEHSQKIYLQ